MSVKTANFTHLNENRLEQFPFLNFFSAPSGYVYFDVDYFRTTFPPINSIECFRKDFSFWIEAIERQNGIDPQEMFLLDAQSGHTMAHTSLMVLFLACTDEHYRAGIFHHIYEMELSGITISDSQLLEIVRNRWSPEFAKQLVEEYGKE